MLLGLRVAALVLLCTPGSATVEELSTGLKAKLEQMGADSMAKRVTAHAANSNHMHTTTPILDHTCRRLRPPHDIMPRPTAKTAFEGTP